MRTHGLHIPILPLVIKIAYSIVIFSSAVYSFSANHVVGAGNICTSESPARIVHIVVFNKFLGLSFDVCTGCVYLTWF